MSITNQTSGAAMAALGQGDWLAELKQNESWLRRVLFNRVGDRDAVDDLMQEIGLAVARPELRPSDHSKFAAWLYRVAVRQAYQHRRKLGRYRKWVSVAARTAATEAREGDPLSWLMRREQGAAIQQAIGRLSDTDREILMLKYSENWTYQQLADRLGVTVHTVEHRLLKAKQRFRGLLHDANVEV